MCLSLDHFTSPVGSQQLHPPGCKREIKEHLHLVRSSWGGKNRFMDKPLSFVVDPLTRAGAMGEHSPVDALVPSIVSEYAVVKGVSHDSYATSPEVVSGESSTPGGWRGLEWITDSQMELEFREAEERAKAVIADSDDNVFHFSTYGADWIKSRGKSRHSLFTIHTTWNTVLTKSTPSVIHSPVITRRIHPDGSTIGVVPYSGKLYCDIRDGTHAVISPWADGDNPNTDE